VTREFREKKALVLAAGQGTRLRPLTDRVPKCLVEIDGRPLLDYWLERLEACGISEALVNTHHLSESVRGFLEEARTRLSYRLTESFEPELLGPEDLCLVIYADNLSTVDLEAMVDFHLSHEDPFSMLLFHTSRPKECGIATLDDVGRIVAFTEKPENPPSDLANAGVYVVDGTLYAEIAAMDAFDIGFDVLPKLKGRMRGFIHDGFHMDIGNLDALETARREAPVLFRSRR
jgi:mannose-1-phosphate guanylyltransferase